MSGEAIMKRKENSNENNSSSSVHKHKEQVSAVAASSMSDVVHQSSTSEAAAATLADLSEDLRKQLNHDLAQLKRKHKEERKNVTLFKSPIQTLHLFILEVLNYASSAISYLQSHWLISSIVVFVITSLFALKYIEGPHYKQLNIFFDEAFIALEWIILGVLSSIGLGTGLHTFVLYLGPFIAKVTLAATECNSMDFEISGPNAFLCSTDASGNVTFYQIFRRVQFAAFMWGFGTAIGELPPYFVARAARLSGKKLEDVENNDEDNDDDAGENEHDETLFHKIMQKMRVYIDFALGRFAFISILLLASVPNPFFDLAGLTCGYSLISFWTFFGATTIGKAGVKAHLQAASVVALFTREHLETLVDLIDKIPFLKGKAKAFFDKERAKFHPKSSGNNAGAAVPSEKSLFARIWDMVLIVMLLTFALSIVNSTAQSYLLEQQQLELSKYKQERIAELLNSQEKVVSKVDSKKDK